MIQIKFETIGLTEFINKNNKLINALENGDFNKVLADYAEKRAKYRAPRKRGILIKGIKTIVEGAEGFILECRAENKKGESYPEYLEEGTKYIKVGSAKNPRVIKSGGGKLAYLPFLKWALWRTTKEANKIFNKMINKYYK